MPTSLPLTPVADIVYNLPNVGGVLSGFNLGLIIGTSTVISADDRVEVYASLDEMIDAGFSTSSAEYLSATLYFAASSQPSNVAIGRWASGETALVAVQACRVANQDWYICYVPTATDEDHLDIAAYIQTLDTPYSQYFLQSENSTVLAGESGNLFEVLDNLSYTRTQGLYSTSDYAMAGMMGYDCGAANLLADSSFTEKFKTITGAVVDNITTQQVNNIETVSGNVYINRGNFYDMYENGTNFGGQFFDTILGLDQTINLMQIGIVNLLTTTRKVPQTEDGVGQIKAVINAACQTMVQQGFIAPGVWNGGNLLALKTGDILATGYLVQSQPINEQSEEDRAARMAPPIYVAIKLAGAIHSVVVRITVNP